MPYISPRHPIHSSALLLFLAIAPPYQESLLLLSLSSYTTIFGSRPPPPQVLIVGAKPSISYTLPIVLFLKVGVSGYILPTCITSPLSIVDYLWTITVSCGMGWSDAICVANDSILAIVHSPFYLHIGCSYRFLCYPSWL